MCFNLCYSFAKCFNYLWKQQKSWFQPFFSVYTTCKSNSTAVRLFSHRLSRNFTVACLFVMALWKCHLCFVQSVSSVITDRSLMLWPTLWRTFHSDMKSCCLFYFTTASKPVHKLSLKSYWHTCRTGVHSVYELGYCNSWLKVSNK